MIFGVARLLYCPHKRDELYELGGPPPSNSDYRGQERSY